MSAMLKEELLRLLREDIEFRYTVIGYLGLDEVIGAIRSLQEQVFEHTRAIRILQEQVSEHTKAIRALREDVKILQEQVFEHSKAIRALQEQVAEHSKEIRALQEQVLEHSKEIRALREDVKALQEQVLEHTKAIRALQEQVKLLQEQVAEHGEALKELGGKVSGLISALTGLSQALGVTLEEFAREFLKGLLEARGVPEEKLKLERGVLRIEGREVEIDVFNEDPLVVGEVTSLIESVEEVEKVVERVRVVESLYGRKPNYAFLIAPTIRREAFRDVVKRTKESGIELIYGRATQ